MSDFQSVPRYHLRIQPSKGFVPFNLAEIWQFRGMLAALAVRDIKLRYRQTALGISWVVLQPLIASGVLAFVFGAVAGITKPGRSSVFAFVLGGFVSWSLFNGTFTRVGQSLLQHSALISKVFFPRIILPLSALLAALVDAAVAFVLFFGVSLCSGISFGWEVLTLPLWLSALLLFSLGLGLSATALSVRYRDVQHITPVLVQILFYASPIAYGTAAVPEKWRGLFSLNPLAPLFEGVRWSLLREGEVKLFGVLYAVVISLLVLGVGVVLFSRAEREFADII